MRSRRRAAPSASRAGAARRSPTIGAMLAQRTLKSMTRAVGVGLHSGQKVELTLRPGAARHRHRVPPRRPAAAGRHPGRRRSPSATPAWPRRSRPTATRRAEGARPIEHLLSACAGLGLDNLVVDITAEEVPILDGSAASFVFLLQSAGIALQDAPKRFLRVLRPVEVRRRRGRRRSSGRASSRTTATSSRFEIEFDHPVVERDRPALRLRHGLGPVQERDRARPHLRLHQGRRDDARRAAWRSAAAWTTRSSSTSSGCSTARACATTTSSSSTRSSTPSATWCSSASRCWPRTAPSSAGHALNNRLVRALLADRTACEIVTFDDEPTAPAGSRRAGAGMVNLAAACASARRIVRVRSPSRWP